MHITHNLIGVVTSGDMKKRHSRHERSNFFQQFITPPNLSGWAAVNINNKSFQSLLCYLSRGLCLLFDVLSAIIETKILV